MLVTEKKVHTGLKSCDVFEQGVRLAETGGPPLDLTDMLTTATNLDEGVPPTPNRVGNKRGSDPFEGDECGDPMPLTTAGTTPSPPTPPDLSGFRPPDVTLRRVWPYDISSKPLDEELWVHSFARLPRQIANILLNGNLRGRRQRRDHHMTVIVLDWDDTLFASTWMHLIQKDLWKKTYEEFERQHAGTDHATRLQYCPQWAQLYDRRRFSPADHKHLLAIEEASLALLRVCCGYGKVIIVTNAEPGWVELSGSKFMPKVIQFIEQQSIQIISARATFAHTLMQQAYAPQAQRMPCDGEPDAWKVNAFCLLIHKILKDIRKQPIRSNPTSVDRHRESLLLDSNRLLKDGGTSSTRSTGPSTPAVNRHYEPPPVSPHSSSINMSHRRIGSTTEVRTKLFTLLSIGDSECERRALLRCRQLYYPSGYFKSVKLVENPHPILLKRQLDYLKNVVPKILEVPDSVDLVFEPPPPRLPPAASRHNNQYVGST